MAREKPPTLERRGRVRNLGRKEGFVLLLIGRANSMPSERAARGFKEFGGPSDRCQVVPEELLPVDFLDTRLCVRCEKLEDYWDRDLLCYFRR